MRIAIWAIVAWLGLNLLLLTLWFAYGRVLWHRHKARNHTATVKGRTAPKPPRAIGEPDAQLAHRTDLRAQLLDALIAALQDPYPPTRREAVRALKGIGDFRAIAALERAATSDPSSEVRDEAVEAVALLKRRQAREQPGGADEAG